MPIWTGISLGGALGALSRYYFNLFIQGRLGQSHWASFPLGTLVINVIGSFLLGLVIALSARDLVSPELRLAFGTGFVGAFTTFSTFEWESDLLLRSGESGRAALYILGNLLSGYVAVLFGRWVASRIGGLV
ncbi:fluoride efflux transporter CrcB [Deinococcus detaillensis]|uniref:Fluoride-specific ion channel FluC n=1 Tax=Deinococcus detaillensis TaxID=2592048 RepID=A0A553UZ77_9DEIO|nr:fluoride efflux transporter CrcB [Deinococcus detaillensis]TSA85523.1 fluoride efflux transporter CrcB [Deinococcus detaillensis]